MSTPDDIAGYFAGISGRREAALRAASADLARATAAGSEALGEIERVAEDAIRAVVAAVEQAQAAGDAAPEAAPTKHDDEGNRFLQRIIEAEDSAGGDYPERWRP